MRANLKMGKLLTGPDSLKLAAGSFNESHTLMLLAHPVGYKTGPVRAAV